jgi:hypothetical protein
LTKGSTAAFASREMPLDLPADHHFNQHPVLTDDEPDLVLTEEARAGFAWLRHVLDGVATGYLSAEERDTTRLLRLIELTNARDTEPALTPGTSIAERFIVARQSFRPSIRKICDFLRAWADQHRTRSEEVRQLSEHRHGTVEAQPAPVVH